MPIPFVGRSGPAAHARRRAAVAKSLRIVTAEPLRVGTQPVTLRATGIPRIGWAVFQNVAPNYPWYTDRGGDNIAVPAGGDVVVNVQLSAVGDKIKLFESTGPEARDFTNQVESAGALAAPGSTTPTTGTGNAAAILAKMGLGVNQERFTVLPENHPQARSASYYQYYRGLGIRNVRFFIPAGFYGWTLQPSAGAGDMAPWLDAVQACLDSGMPVVHLDGMDVVEDGHVFDQDDGHVTGVKSGEMNAADGYIQRFAAAVAARNFPVDRFIVGAINEYGGADNAAWEPHRIRWNNYLRAALPSHTIVEGPCNWKDARALFSPDTVPWGSRPSFKAFNKWGDANSIVDCHHYFDWPADGMEWLCAEMRKWSIANNRGVYMGEHGFNGFTGDMATDAPTWITRMDAQTAYEHVCLIRPCLWAVTDGTAWPINQSKTNTMRTDVDMAGAVKRWAGRVDTRIGSATPTTPAQPTTPPPEVPGSGDTLNIIVRGQSNAHYFCDWGNGYPEGVRLMRERIAALTGRTVHTIYGFNNAGDNTIYGGTEFLTQWMDGTGAGELENAFLRFIGSQTADRKAAPVVEIWMHNESDQKNNPATATWVNAVRAEAALARSALGLTASQYLRYFVPIRYPYGDITSIKNGMDQLAADPSFNARVSMAAWSLRMDGDDHSTPNSNHLGWQDARDLAENLAQELAALYPAGSTAGTPPRDTGGTPTPAPSGRSISISPSDPPGNSTGAYSGTLTVAGISRVTVAVQNDANGDPPWGFASTREYTVPANGQVPITATFTANGQFLQVFDTSDQAFATYGGSFYFA